MDRELFEVMRKCSDQDLREILQTDPDCPAEYREELRRRERRKAEVKHWETFTTNRARRRNRG